MEILVNGGKRLSGKLNAQGAKNSILPILSACVLCRQEVILHNCPMLSDVNSALNILEHLGIKSERCGSDIVIKCKEIECCEVPEKLMREMRSSVVFLGAILASSGCAKISMPGGCELGPRPIDIHISALKKLGAEINEDYGSLSCKTPYGFVGTEISLLFPSVGATENIILAAATAKGVTTITNAAREPEIVDLANFINACGGKVYGAGSGKVIVEGVKKLGGCEYSIMPDRIVSVTYLTAAAITGGDVFIKGAKKEDIDSTLSLFEQTGCNVINYFDGVRLKAAENLKGMQVVKTMPYPGFPTDAQAPLMALSTVCNGTTMFVETIFENRYRHVNELQRMGADIKTEGKVAVVNGVKRLSSALLNCTDLRGGAALVLAALNAEGTSVLKSIEHIDRGYENIEGELTVLGADVLRK